MDTSIRVLILEDNAADAELIRRELRKAGINCATELAADEKSFLAALDRFTPDVILADYSLPGFDGLTALTLARRQFPAIPVIIVSGRLGEEAAIDTLKAGATDYVLKQRLKRLGSVVARAIQEAEQLAARDRAEQSLRERDEELRLVMDAGPTLIAYIDRDYRYRRVNRSYRDWYGMILEEVQGRHVQEVLGEAAWRTVEPYVRRALAGEAVTYEYELSRPTGSRWVRATYTPSRDHAGRVRGFVVHALDVSEHKRLEEMSRRAKETAETANAAKSRFLANMSHELRTPMNAILGLIDVALTKSHDAIVQDCLQTAKDSADMLLALLNELLDSAKIESGKLELASAPFSLRRMLDQVTRVLSVRASEKSLSFYCRLPDETPDAVLGDQIRLRQILLNLAGNAIKFTERGEVEIGLHIVEGLGMGGEGLGTGDWGLENDGQAAPAESLNPIPHLPSPIPNPSSVTLEFTVRDTGIGISAADQKHLFRPFSQVDVSMTRRFGGTGLGLAISKSLVEMMGGTIWVDSAPRKGSTFHFTVRLPLADELPPEPAAASPVPVENGAPLHILLVEDNPANQKVGNYVLRDRGHVVHLAHNGRQAIEMAARHHYDAILMDVQMPGMDGLEAAAAIRKLETDGRSGMGDGGPGMGFKKSAVAACTSSSNPSSLISNPSAPISNPPSPTPSRRVPIIAMTAHAMRGDRERCLAAGMDGYLAKPVNARDMIGLVESLAHGAAAGSPIAAETPKPTKRSLARRPPAKKSRSVHVPSLEKIPGTDHVPPAVPIVFDFDEAVSRCFDNVNMARDMIRCFFDDVDTLFPKMREALAASDLIEVGRLGHRMKGTVVYLAAEPAKQAALAVERFVTGNGTPAEAERAVEALRRECLILKAALEAKESDVLADSD